MDFKAFGPGAAFWGTLDQYQFVFGNMSHKIKRFNNTKIFVVDFSLHRVFYYYLWTTFFPTTCLLIIACLTVFIDPLHFEATICVSLTTMLVMYTLHQSTSADLPKTSHMKMIDVWLVFGTMIPFVVFVCLVLIELVPTDEVAKMNPVIKKFSEFPRLKRTTKKEVVQKAAKIIIPGFTIAFSLGYTCFAFYIRAAQQ